MKLGVCILLGAIFEAKKTGKGRVGKGKIYIEIMKMITDNNDISLLFSGNTDRFLLRLLRGETEYPYLLFRFEKFEKCIGDYQIYRNYIAKMKKFCDMVLDENKIKRLVYTLLEILRQDDTISDILYGSEFIPKEKLFGSYAHPKKICVEALLLGLLYYTHKNPAESKKIELLNTPDRLRFHVIRFNDDKSLKLEMPIKLIENIHENAKRQKSEEMKYRLEIRIGDTIISGLPDIGNIFLYGTGGAGKTTLLLNQISSDNSVNFYFPLYKYKREIHENLQSESCWILLQILLKYHYQYEYQTYESCAACEGENAILQQLKELNNLLKLTPIIKYKFELLLDGINELPSESQEQLVDELKYIVSEWKNVRIIITGRTVPMYSGFDGFQQLEICGILDSERDRALSGFAGISANTRLLEILKTPLFLNMYLESDSSKLNTRGEILDSYVMNIQSRLPQDSAVKFVVQYALPFAAKMMTDGFSYEIDRGDLSEAIDSAIEFYLENKRVYQNYIAPKKSRKRNLLECMGKTDFMELLIENICFLAVSSHEPQKLHFTHQYFRDYFAAKHILNLAEALSVSYEYKHTDERTELFKKHDLDMMWFYDEDDIYRLIGEISGDYKNAPCENFIYQRTVLDSILDMSRDISTLHTAECVMKSMSLVRNGILCGVDFSGMCLPIYIPHNVKFSLNGQHPCRFRYCWVFMLALQKTSLDSDNAINFEKYLQLQYFKNCDFTGAEFFDDEGEKLLRIMGAVVD